MLFGGHSEYRGIGFDTMEYGIFTFGLYLENIIPAPWDSMV